MTEHTEQTPGQPSATPTRIGLEDFIEAVTRGVTRALAAQDEVSGYAAQLSGTSRSLPQPIIIGIMAPQPPNFPDLADLPGSQTTLQRG